MKLGLYRLTEFEASIGLHGKLQANLNYPEKSISEKKENSVHSVAQTGSNGVDAIIP